MGWTSFDLRHAQLAIVAMTWNCSDLRDLLASGVSFWQLMSDYLGLGPEDKPSLKTATYAMIFGAGRKRIVETLESTSAGAVGERFLSHPIVLELMVRRTLVLNCIQASGRVTDAYGIEWTTDLQGSKRARSLLAARIQSYESRILVPAIRPLIDVGEVRLVGYLHDGFTLSDGNRKVAHVEDQIRNRVAKSLKELGIVSELE